MIKFDRRREVNAEIFALTSDPLTSSNIGEVMLRLEHDGDVMWYRANSAGWGEPLPRGSRNELEDAYAIFKRENPNPSVEVPPPGP